MPGITTNGSACWRGEGISAEIIFPDGITEKNTPPFGAGLGLSPRDMVPELQWAGAMGIYVSEVMWWLYRPLTFMIWGGVFERFPRLKAMIVEGGTMFMLLPWLKLMDFQYHEGEISAKLGDFKSHLPMPPSAYFNRNVGIGASCVKRPDLDLREQIGLEKIMWGSDFPHPEGTWPHTQEYYRDTFAGLPERDGRRILGENAVDFYGLDREKLQAVADDIGPDTSIFH